MALQGACPVEIDAGGDDDAEAAAIAVIIMTSATSGKNSMRAVRRWRFESFIAQQMIAKRTRAPVFSDQSVPSVGVSFMSNAPAAKFAGEPHASSTRAS